MSVIALLGRCLAGMLALSVAIPALAQTYPSKPIRVILGIGIGSPTDVVLRAVGSELLGSLGQPLIVDNRPGANNRIAMEACARAAADGYTLCVVNHGAVSYSPHLFSKLPYDPDKDYAPITLLWYLIQGLVASPSLAANSIKELQELATIKSASISFGTLGDSSGGDILRQTMNEYWKANMVGIPYKGANLLASALVSGEIQLGRISLNGLSGQVKAGKLKIIAVNSLKRSGLFPDVPTFAEAGLASFPDEKVWWGLFGPAAMPNPMVKRINGEVARLFRSPKFAAYLENQLLESAVTTPEEFAVFLREDRERAGLLLRKFNVPRQ
jgi:tripartite-type tricarboxylate transporter receptor subunit TctC